MTSKPVRKAVLGSLLAVLWLAGGCGSTHGSSESETHFLELCQDRCGAGLECICGICTKTCDSADACRGLAAAASCETISAGACADEPVSVCDVKCASDAECDELGSGYVCEAGACRWGTALTASDADGIDATGVGGSGTGGSGTGASGAGGLEAGSTEAGGGDASVAPLADTTLEYPACSSSIPEDFAEPLIPELVRPPTCDDPLTLGATLVDLAPPIGEPLRASSLVADWNGDGQFDLASVTSTGVSVLFGGGDGTLGSRVDSPMTLGDPGTPEAIDLNLDGALDLVITGYGYNTVNVLFGDGSGAFSCGTTYTTGALPAGSAVDDFSGDGLDDIAVLNQNDGTVQILLGAADGTLRAGDSFRVGPNPSSVSAGDFNDDQVTDLAIALYNEATLSLFIGSGDGQFRQGSEFAAGNLPSIVESKDLNADGYLDLVVAHTCTPSDSPGISVLLGTGYGFTEPDTYPSINCVLGVSAGDVNGDSIIDLLGPEGPLFGKGDGTFLAADPSLSSGHSFALLDWDDDGKLDIVQTYDGTAHIELGNGDGSFGSLLKSEVSDDSETVEAFLLADLNADGTLDGAFTKPESVVVAAGAGDGTFSVQGTYTTGQRPRDIVAADLNGDHRMDLVTTNYDSSTVGVLIGAADGGFTTTEYGVGQDPFRLAVADLNADETPDLVVTTNEDASVSVLLGLGDGSFAAEVTYPVREYPHSVFLRDLNGDGALDAILGREKSTVLFGVGDGSFAPEADLEASESHLLAVEDLNRDGSFDLVTAVDDAVAVELGRDDGSFEASTLVYTEPTAWSREPGVGDLDADGHLDLLIGGVVLRGAGDGTFRCAERHTPSDYLGDVNGDGSLDAVSMGTRTITVALNGSD